MALQSRVLDAMIIGEEAAPGTEAVAYDVDVFGHITSSSLVVDEERRVINGMTGGTSVAHLPTRIVPLKATPTGSISFEPPTLQFFKYVISDYTEGVGTYTMANRSIALPTSLSMKGAYDGTKGVRHLGCYLTNVRLGLTAEDTLKVTADIVSLFADTFTGSVSYTPPSLEPLTYAGGVFTMDGNEWDLQSLNYTINPKFIQKFTISSKSTNKKRFPTTIIRGSKMSIGLDGVANIQSAADEIETAWGGTSPQDSVSSVFSVLTFTDILGETHAITTTGQVSKVEVTQSDSEENSKTFNFTGVATDFRIDGTM